MSVTTTLILTGFNVKKIYIENYTVFIGDTTVKNIIDYVVKYLERMHSMNDIKENRIYVSVEGKFVPQMFTFHQRHSRIDLFYM